MNPELKTVVKIDETDMKIVDQLKENGRIQNNEIAARLGISEGTVRNRIKKLIDNNFLTIKGLVNPAQISEKQIIFLGIQLSEVKNFEKAVTHISSLPDVVAVYMITGRYDLLVEIFIASNQLLRFLSEDLATVDCLASTESFITLKSYKKWVY